MSGPDRRQPLNFGIAVDPIGPVPVVFFAMRVPCACGRSLDEPVYTFFPSSVFVHGTCRECGPQTAIFAPHMKAQMEDDLPDFLAKSLQTIMQQVGRIYHRSPDQILAELFDTLAKHEATLAADAERADVA